MTQGFGSLPPPPAKWPYRIFMTMFAVGMLTVFAGLGLTLRAQRMLATSHKVEGTIVAVVPAPNNGGKQSFYPVVQAEDEDGKPFKIIGWVSTYPPPTIGATVTLAYPPGQPQAAFIVGFIGVWFLPALVGGLGAVWTIVGLAILFATGRPSRP